VLGLGASCWGSEGEWGVEAVAPEAGIVDIWLRMEEPPERARVELSGVPGGSFELVVPSTGPEAGGERLVARVRVAPGTGRLEGVRFWEVDGGRRDEIEVSGNGTLARAPAAGAPAWAMGAAWYQIFPERFRNGNEANDPRGPGAFDPGWTSVWEEVSPAEIEAAMATRAGTGRGSFRADRGGEVLYKVVWDRRYGGDLQGVVEKLDYLKELGVTGIYLNPIFDARSLHKYDASDHRHVDPTLGHPGDPYAGRWAPAGETADPETWRWTEADRYFVETLLPACRERGLRVVLDGVWNHVGRAHWAFRDVMRNGADSRYAGWFRVRFGEEGELVGWEAWDGANGGLPEFRQTIEGDLVEPVKRHVFAVTRRWMDPNGDGDPSDGIDGWRLDVVPDIGLAFWRDWCALVREINPDAVTIAEVWHRADAYLDGETFDAQMNYPFARAVVRWLEGRGSYGSRELARDLGRAAALRERVTLAQMNLLGSHDTERIASMLHNPGREYSTGGELHRGARDYDSSRPSEEAYELAEVGLAISVCWPGSATVYYGDEWGVYGADDPDCRKPLPWPELGPYAAAAAPMRERPERYRAWLELARDERLGEVLRFGLTRHVETADADLFAFERRLGESRVVFVANRGPRDKEVDVIFGGCERVGPGGGLGGAVLKARSAGVWWNGR